MYLVCWTSFYIVYVNIHVTFKYNLCWTDHIDLQYKTCNSKESRMLDKIEKCL